jgi:hypothetical protein
MQQAPNSFRVRSDTVGACALLGAPPGGLHRAERARLMRSDAGLGQAAVAARRCPTPRTIRPVATGDAELARSPAQLWPTSASKKRRWAEPRSQSKRGSILAARRDDGVAKNGQICQPSDRVGGTFRIAGCGGTLMARSPPSPRDHRPLSANPRARKILDT